MDINFFIILLLVFLLFLGPFLGVIHLREKAKNQQLAYRLQIMNRFRVALSNHQPIIKKQTPPSWINMRNIFLYFIVPIPALFIILVSGSIPIMLSQIIIYFSIVFSIYFFSIKIRAHKYKKAFIEQFPNAIDLMIRNLRAGRTIIDSIKTAAEEMKGPVSWQLQSIYEQVELGRDFITVINDLSAELDIPEFTFFGIVLSVQQETGGNIIKTLNSLVTMLRGRHLMRLKIKALSAEGIMSAIIMSSLPFIVATIIFFIRPGYFDIMFIDPMGKKLLIASVLCELLGCLFIVRTLRIEV